MNQQVSLYQHLPYRLCVGVMMVNDQKQVFVARRIDTKVEAWQMPQGGIDEGETPKQAMFRELEEEIGTNHVEIIAESADWHSYNIPDYLVPKLWNGKYQGQTQKWFLVRFLGDDDKINIQTPHPEFSHWRWASPDQLPELIVSFKQELYAKLVEEFAAQLAAL